LLTRSFPGIFIRAPIVKCILPKVDGIQKDEQVITEIIVTPSRQVVDSQARKVTLQDIKVMAKARSRRRQGHGEGKVMATLPGRLKKAREARAKINADEEIGT
jgi:hypothetical protein